MRSRDIKPGFFKNDQLAECSFAARLLFPGLWMIADREGRIENRPKRIKAEIFPYDNVDVAALLEELRSNGLIEFYEVNGGKFIWIPTFKIHQNPHKNEKQSELPPSPHELGQIENNENREKNGTAPEISGQSTTKEETSTQQILLTPSSLTPDILTPDSQIYSREKFSRENPEQENPKPEKPIPTEYVQFAQDFQEAVAADQGECAPKITQKLIQDGAKELDKAIRLDGFELDEIRRALAWAQSDYFWRSNLLSLAQMRKKTSNGTSKIQTIVSQYRRSLIPHKSGPPQYESKYERDQRERRESMAETMRILGMLDGEPTDNGAENGKGSADFIDVSSF